MSEAVRRLIRDVLIKDRPNWLSSGILGAAVFGHAEWSVAGISSLAGNFALGAAVGMVCGVIFRSYLMLRDAGDHRAIAADQKWLQDDARRSAAGDGEADRAARER